MSAQGDCHYFGSAAAKDTTVAVIKKNEHEAFHVTIRESGNRHLVDLRIFTSDGRQTSRGIAIKFAMLRATIEALEEAERIAGCRR